MVALVNKPFEANIFGISKLFMLPPTTSLLDDSFMIELTSDWVNESDETMAVYTLHLSPDVTHVVTGGTRYVSGLRLVDALLISEIIELDVYDRREMQ